VSTRIQNHPRFAELSRMFEAKPELFGEWSGT